MSPWVCMAHFWAALHLRHQAHLFFTWSPQKWRLNWSWVAPHKTKYKQLNTEPSDESVGRSHYVAQAEQIETRTHKQNYPLLLIRLNYTTMALTDKWILHWNQRQNQHFSQWHLKSEVLCPLSSKLFIQIQFRTIYLPKSLRNIYSQQEFAYLGF